MSVVKPELAVISRNKNTMREHTFMTFKWKGVGVS